MPNMWSRWRVLPVRVRDGELAAALTVVGQVELVMLADQVQGSRALQHVAFAVMTASVAWRRLRPLVAAIVCSAALGGQTLLGEAPAAAGYIALLIATYSVAEFAPRRRDAVLGLVAVLAAVELYPFVADDVSVADEVVNALIPVLVWIFARLARERLDRAVRAEQEAMATRARSLEERVAAASAIASERRRIAREMHDVVAHGVTLMLLHAGAAQASLGGREPVTSQALDVVLDSGRTAVGDLHRILRLLREGDEPEDAPGSLSDLDRLAQSSRAAGLAVDLSLTGDARPLPAAVEATAYRVVQESLTNALKHAAASRVQVSLRYAAAGLEITVIDNGTRRTDSAASPGYGLVGIRERVALFDGRVSAGPRTDGAGWRLSAVLPIPAPAMA